MPQSLIELQRRWANDGAHETGLHRLAPYIGKLRPGIARVLISSFSAPTEIVFDPFSGSGVVPLESLRLGRGAIANDVNPYAAVLTRAKMLAPRSIGDAIRAAAGYVDRAKSAARLARYDVAAPAWVRRFFHRRTLAEAVILARLLKDEEQWFLLASLMGILHHQRPGFLSYPSSHLVPYLRNKKFPRGAYPSLYGYRDVEPRLTAKVERSFKDFGGFDRGLAKIFTEQDIHDLACERRAHLALTSPPYMNALDYGRDNRLRLWFLGVEDFHSLDALSPSNADQFRELMITLAHVLDRSLVPTGRAILVVGEVRRRRGVVNTGELVRGAFESGGGNWVLVDQIRDTVPDIRRCRRRCCATKSESVMIFRKKVQR